MTYDLKTQKGRNAALANIHSNCLSAFISAGVELSPDVEFEVSAKFLVITIKKTKKLSDFSSSVHINCGNTDRFSGFNEPTISFGSTGSFTPENKSSYWRTIHAASCLKKWFKVCRIVGQSCLEYRELIKKIKEENPEQIKN